MPRLNKYYRLRIRNAADSANALVISSFPSDTNPYILEPPSGDGQSFSPLNGEIFTGSYTCRVIDAETAANTRVVTAILADVDARQQLLSRKGIVETSADGTAWTELCNGYVNALRLDGGLVYEFAIGETQRKEITRDVFKVATPYFNATTAIIGGPIIGGFGPIRDYGGWRYKVSQVHSAPDYVQLKLKSGFDPRKFSQPGFNTTFTRTNNAITDYTNGIARNYFEPSSQWFVGALIGGSFPGLTVRVQETNGTVVGYFTPLAEPRRLIFPGKLSRDDLLMRAGESSLWIDNLTGTDVTGAPLGTWTPTVGHQYDVYVYINEIGPENPLHYYGHPVDLWENLRLDNGIPYDATVLAAVKAEVGNDLRLSLRITQSYKLGDFDRQVIYAPFGLATRMEGGKRVLFSSRIRTAAVPSVTLTVDDLTNPGKPFDLSEETAIKTVVLKQLRLVEWTTEETDQPEPDALIAVPSTISIENSDTDATVDGAGEVVFDIPGTIISLRGGGKSSFTRSWQLGTAREIFDRWGRGIVGVEIQGLPNVTAKLGNEIILDLPHLPVPVIGNTPVTQRGTATRIYQIVYRTETPTGPTLKLLDAGNASAPGVVPTFTIAANAADTRKYIDLVITNAAALIAINASVRVWVATGSAAPASGSGILATTLDPAVTTALTLPPFDAGTKVWVQMQSVIDDQRPGALSAYQSVQLTVLDPPTTLAVTAQDAADPSRRTLSWVVGTNATDIPLEVAIRLTAETSAANRVIALLPPGSTQFELTGLDTENRTASVRHIEQAPFAGASAYATVAVNTSGAFRVLNPPINPRVFSSSGGVYGMDVNATEFPSEVEFQVKVGAGAFETVASVTSALNTRTRWSGAAPNDGAVRSLRARHTADGATESAWTTTLTVTPWAEVSAPVEPPATLSGSGPPGIELGVDGDFYIDVSTTPDTIYGPKTGGTWGTGTPIGGGVGSGYSAIFAHMGA